MQWTIIGSGRMGTALARWLDAISSPAVAVVSRRGVEAWLQRSATIRAGGLLLAVPDDAVAPLARRLAAARTHWRGWRVLHTSGARPAAELAPLRRHGAAIGSLHPMMTFTHSVPPSPQGIVFSLEGDAAACRAAAQLVNYWGGLPLPLDAKAKASFHLAATLIGPGAVIAMAAAESLLHEAGLSGPRLRRARTGLLSLLAATQANLGQGTASAWTGPFARGDWATVARQRRQLSSPALRQLYDGLAASAAKLLPCDNSHPRQH